MTDHIADVSKKVGPTPTPVYLTKTDGNFWLIVSTADDRNLCYCDTKEKGEIIVRAVNFHEALLEIVKELRDAIQRGGDLQLGPKGRNANLEERVDRVIAQAEGEVRS